MIQGVRVWMFNSPYTSSTSNAPSTDKLQRTLTQLPANESAEPETHSTVNQGIHLTWPKIILLGACTNLAVLSSGFSFNAMSISLDQAARDLKIAEKDLQWTFNALYLAMVRDEFTNSRRLTKLTDVYFPR
jgi:hypothetical protein